MIVEDINQMALDKKGRWLIPKEERPKFGDKVVLIRRNKNFLLILNEREWQEIMNKTLSGLKGEEFLRRKRVLFRSSFYEKIDKDGWVFVQPQLRR